MTVRELIERLKEMPQDMVVRYAYDGIADEVMSVQVEAIGAGRGHDAHEAVVLE